MHVNSRGSVLRLSIPATFRLFGSHQAFLLSQIPESGEINAGAPQTPPKDTIPLAIYTSFSK